MGSNATQILLTADWRLHEVCEGILRVDPESADRLSHAPRDAVRLVVDFAINEQVDILVNAGNTLAPNLACPSDYNFLYGELERLANANIDVVWNWSPLDEPQNWPRCFQFPSNVRRFTSSTPQVLKIPLKGGESVNFVGIEAAGNESVSTEWFDGIDLQGITFGVSHSTPQGEGPGFDGWLVAGKGYSVVRDEKSLPLIKSGSPQSRSPKQTGPHGAVLINACTDAETDLQFIDTSVLEYHNLQVAIQEHDRDTLLEAILDQLANRTYDEKLLNAIEIELHTELPSVQSIPLKKSAEALSESIQSIFAEVSSSLFLTGISIAGEANFGSAEHEEIIGEFLFAIKQLKESGWEQLNLRNYLPNGEYDKLATLTEDLDGLNIINRSAALAVSLFERTDREAA